MTASAGHTSRLSDTAGGVYVPSSRSAVAQSTLSSLTALQRTQGQAATARRPVLEQIPLALPKQPQQQRLPQWEGATDDSAASSRSVSGNKTHGSSSDTSGTGEAEKDQPSLKTTSSTPRPRPPLLLHAHSSASLTRITIPGDPHRRARSASARPGCHCTVGESQSLDYSSYRRPHL